MRLFFFSSLLFLGAFITPVQAADVEPIFITTATCPDNSSYVKGYWSCPGGYDKNIVSGELKSCTKKTDCSECSGYPYTTVKQVNLYCINGLTSANVCTCSNGNKRYSCKEFECIPQYDNHGVLQPCAIK